MSTITINNPPWTTITGLPTTLPTTLPNSMLGMPTWTSHDIATLYPTVMTQDVCVRDPKTGKVVSISQDEILKYIGERELRETNEAVRVLWDRYQVAVKLIGSASDGQEA